MLRNIVTVGQSELATAVIKATYPDSDLPKAKHVIAIVQTISKAPHLAREVSELIKQRIERCLKSGSQYRMLFKCLLVLHKLAMQRDSQNLIKVLVAMPLNFLHLSSYLDRTSTTSWGHSLFCRQYAAYIAQKVSSCRELGTSYEHTNSDTKNHMSALKPKKLGKISDILITQLEALLECKAYQEAFDTEGGGLLSKMAISLLTRDLFGLTTILNLALYSMMDFLTDLDKKTTKSFIKSVDGFLACVPAIAKFRSIAIHEAVSEAKKLLPGSDQLKTSKDWLKKVKTCLETHLLDAPKKSKKKKKKSESEVTTYDLADFLGEDGSSSDASEGKPSPTSIPETKLGDSWGNFDSEFARLSTGRIKGASGDKVKSKVMSFPSKKAKKLKKKQKQKPREKTREQTLPDFLDFNPINDETPTPATNPEDSSFLNDIFSNYSSKPQSNGAYGAVSKSPF